MSRPCRGLIRPLILCAVLASVAALGGCSTVPSAPTIPLTESQRAPCQTPADEPLATQADSDALTLRLAMLLVACSREKVGLVEVIDLHNAAVKPKPWWRFF